MKASPQHRPPPAQKATLSGPYGAFRQNNALKAVIFAWLILAAMLTLLSLIAPLFVAPEITESRDHYLDITLRAVAMAGILSQILCLPFYCWWVNRTCKNAWLLNPPKMKTTPARAVGYYFIPVVSIWKPYVSMCEMRQASYGMSTKLKSLLAYWWFFWLAYMLLTACNLVSQFSYHDELITMRDKLSMIAGITAIVVNYLTAAVVLSMTNAQNRQAAQW
ncbi:MAG: DUF4328 domain-containing protein [Akkermansiaceae bacterium]